MNAPKKLSVSGTFSRVIFPGLIATLMAGGSAQAQAQVTSPNSTGTQTSQAAQPALPPITNLIIGGGMSHCSSYGGADNLSRCTKPWAEILKLDPELADLSMDRVSFEATIPVPTFTYSIDSAKIAAMNALSKKVLSDRTKHALSTQLQTVLADPNKATPLTALSFEQFAQLSGIATLTPSLSMLEMAAIRQTFVEPMPTRSTQRQVQARSVMFQKDTYAAEIYHAFVQAASVAAGGKRPKIGLVTASAENPFNDHDINYYVLKSAGADVVWLPTEGGMRRALDNQDCEDTAIYYAAFASTASIKTYFHMDQLFPDLAKIQRDFCLNNAATLNATLRDIDGIFFTGGNQARILESFITKDSHGSYTKISEQLRILRERYAAGKLVVAGSSAGDAVQAGGTWKGVPIPMISGGEPWRTLANGFSVSTGVMVDDPVTDKLTKGGTLFPNGGLGFFKYGALDSHFSNRAREGRLIRLVKESHMDYGFGVDENTALVVHQPDAQGNTIMGVVGEAGVFIVDASKASTTSIKGVAGAINPLSIKDVNVHYISAGDTLRIDRQGKLTVSLSADKKLLPENPAATIVNQTRVMESGSFNFVKMTQQMGLTGANQAVGTSDGTRGQNAPLFSTNLTRTASSAFRVDSTGRVSYSNLSLSIQPCDGACVQAK